MNAKHMATFFSGLPLDKVKVVKDIYESIKKDIKPSHNLGSFSTTKMEHHVDELLQYFQQYNAVNKNEYPTLTRISKECSSIIAKLFNVDHNENGIGINTVGSSEAAALACLNLKLLWVSNKKKGEIYSKPNLVIGENAHLSWSKFAEYFEIETKIVKTNNLCLMEIEDVFTKVDKNTIGICVTLGTTYTGGFDPIEEISNKLSIFSKQNDIRPFMHVDAASGGFIAPFAFSELKWDFRLSNIISINVSSHKYGFTYPSLGWLIFRDTKYLSKELSKTVCYLSGEFAIFSFNFTMSATSLIAQYYNFLTLGMSGYIEIVNNIFKVKKFIISAIKPLCSINIIEHDQSLPVIIFYLKKGGLYITDKFSDELKNRGWSLPVYQLPNSPHVVARIVIRREMTKELAKELIKDIVDAVIIVSSNKDFSKE